MDSSEEFLTLNLDSKEQLLEEEKNNEHRNLGSCDRFPW